MACHRFGHLALAIAVGGLGAVLTIAALTGFNVPHTVVMTVGLAMALQAPVSVWKSASLLRHSRTATGRVLRIVHTDAGRWGTAVPHVRFQVEGGRSVEFEVAENLSMPREQEVVAVRYDPADPEHSARLAGFGPMFAMDLINGLLGAALAVAGLVWARRYRAGK